MNVVHFHRQLGSHTCSLHSVFNKNFSLASLLALLHIMSDLVALLRSKQAKKNSQNVSTWLQQAESWKDCVQYSVNAHQRTLDNLFSVHEFWADVYPPRY
jgi:hypothetical protein